MNRADLVKQVLLYDQLAAAAKARSATYREQLSTQARAELAAQGMAPSWRLRDVGTVTLPVSQETIYCSSPEAVLEWARRDPDAVEQVTRLRPAWVAAFEKRLTAVDGQVVDTATGEIVPGYAVRAGGLPQSLSIRPTADAKALVRDHAEGLLRRFEATLLGDDAVPEGGA